MTKAEALDKLIKAIEAGAIPLSDLDAFIPSLGLNTQGNDAHSAYRGSLDAAKALHEALLPGWMWLARKTDADDVSNGQCAPSNGGFANVWHNISPNDGGEHFSVFAETAARAFLLATLKAYRAGL